MAHLSYPFKRTKKVIYGNATSAHTNDSKYWEKLGPPVLVKEFGAIDYLDFSPVEPHYFAATCSVRVQVYDPITKVVSKNISKFVEGAYGGTFRADGRLLVAGSEEKAVKLFDVQSKNVLRVFSGHTGPVHRTFFSKDQVKVLSFSDDKSVCVWDMATEAKIACYTEHTDYVRAGAPSPISSDILLSGSYDHSLKLYDCRTKEVVLTANHGSPVESVLFLPSGGIFISAGDTAVKVWDIFNGGKLLASMSQHHKTVTTLRLATNNSRLMTASLDRHVKIYDIATFKVVHNLDFPNAVLSMAISEHDEMLAVGMVDGVISIRKKQHLSQKSEHKKRFFKFVPDHVNKPLKTRDPKQKVDLVVKNVKYPKLCEFDIYLRKMDYSTALSLAIKKGASPDMSVGLIQELLRRKVLVYAMNGLSNKDVGNLMKFLFKTLSETSFTRTMIDATNVFIDVFESQLKSFSKRNIDLYKTLLRAIKTEVDVCKTISQLEGAISLLLAGAQSFNDVDVSEVNEITLAPSSKALKEIIIDV